MKKKLLSLTAVAIVTIGVAAYAIGYEKFKINDASDYVSEYVLEFDANTNKPTVYKDGTYKACTKDHNEITIEYENASANSNGYINLGQGGSIFNPYIEGGYGNNRISGIMSVAVNFTGDLRLSLSAFGSVYGLTNVSLTSGEPYKVTDEILYSYFKLEASLHTSIQSMSIRYSCEYVDTVEFEFTKLDNGYELTHYNGDGGDVTIPDTYLGLPVISIGNSAFEDRESLISVTIPSSVTTIGISAFENCNNLTTVTIGENSQLTSIGSHAFFWCSSLTLITIPNSVTTIGSFAFSGCSNLIIYCEATSKPSGWSSSWNLYNCPVVWGYTGVSGEYNEFEYAVSVDSEGNKYITIIGYSGTDNDVTVPDTINVDGEVIKVTTIAENVFSNNDTIMSVTIGNNVTTIGSFAFYNCDSLTSIIIPDSVTTIGERAFYGCSSLASITIPNGVTTIGERAFYGCDNLTIYCEAASEPSGWDSWWNSSDCPVVWGYTGIIGEHDGLEYEVFIDTKGNKYITIIGYSGTDINVVIPDTINVNGENIPVTTIGSYAFRGCSSLTSITIPDSVTTIGIGAFSDCSSLTTVTFGENSQLTSIGSDAFSWCSSLTSITIPDSVTSIGEWAFYSCDSLTSIIIPDSVDTIYNYAFSDCSSLTTVTFGENSQLTSIGSDAFSWCSSLTSIIIPDSVTSIGSSAFFGCSNLTTVTFGENSQLTSIGEWAFYSCDSLTSITIPDSVTTIGNSAFSGCSSLTSIVIPNNVTTIGYSAFDSCGNLTIYCEATSQPSGWNSDWNPSNCPVVWGYINVSGEYNGLEYIVSIDNEGIKYITITGYNGIDTNVVIPDTINVNGADIPVTTIGSDAFSNNDTITSVTIGDNVTTIGDSAFSGCSNLVSIIIPDGVTTIGDYAFYDCWSLTSITVPDSVTSIGSGAFSNCSSLTSITIPDSVTSIGEWAFDGCDNLTIYCEASFKPNGWSSSWNSFDCPVVWGYTGVSGEYNGLEYAVSIDNEGNKYITIIGYSGTDNDVIIPDTINVDGEDIPVTTIADNAFYENDTIMSVTIGNNVTSIGSYAFYDCSNLTTVTIGENSQLTSIADYAFYYCSSLTSIIIPDSVTSIGSYAFYNCSNLTTVTFGENSKLTTIGDYAFYDCWSLTSITIPDSVTTIGNSAFSDCSSLTTVTFGENSQLTTIGDSAFYNCWSLTSITIPDSVTTIGNSAFSGCSSLTSIVIPNNVTAIGEDAFSGCDNLTIYCEATTKPSGWSSLWNGLGCPVIWGYTGIYGEYNGLEYVVSIDSEGNKYITIIGYSGTDNDVTVPNTINVDGEDIPVTIIGESAFEDCTSLTSITIPNSVREIDDYAFYGSPSLTIFCEIPAEPSSWSMYWNPSNYPVVWGYTR